MVTTVDKVVRIIGRARVYPRVLNYYPVLELALFVSNWGVLAYKGYLVRLGLPYPLCLGSG